MENHWPAVHARKGTAGVDWDYVLLQTFFRGKMLRYFTDQKKQDISSIRAKQITTVKLQKSPVSQSQQGKTSILKQMQEKYHLDSLDSQLLEHYFDSSYKTFVTNKKTEKVWIEVVPGLAYNHNFLFQGILACTALHLAHQNPPEHQKYTLRGCCHQDSAIPEFRQAIETPTEENCDAIIAFAYFLVVYSLATDLEFTAHSLLIVNPNPPNTQQILPPWLHFIRTGCHMLKDVWHRIESGRASVLAAAWERNLNITNEERQHHLGFFLSIIPNDGSWSSESIRLYDNAANVLAESFAYVDRAKKAIGITAWNILGTWPVRIEEGFFTMTSEKHPGALILLAYYCVLLKQIEECWYFGGRPAQMITFIAQILDKQWIPYIANAIDEVLGPRSTEFMRSLPLH